MLLNTTMKTILLCFIAMLISTSAFSQFTSINPDPNFEQALVDQFIDTDGMVNGEILTFDAESYPFVLDVSNKNISDLTGISAFTSITGLDCRDNQLSSLDIRNNSTLKNLYCANNNLSSLDVSSNTLLEGIFCGDNQLTSLDVSSNTMLKFLTFRNNQISNLNLTNNTSLERLSGENNLLTSLDISNATNLNYLNCEINQLTNIDLSANTPH